jgi:hypothetical protein
MRTDLYTKIILTVIAGLPASLAFRPVLTPGATLAQSGADLYIEPGYTALRKPDGTAQVKGKMVVNRGAGEIWGFPTLVDGPYPVDSVNSEPPVSTPMYLGRFDFSRIKP